MTHAELVEIAFKWLCGSQRCSVVVSELSTGGRERPDAIGWRGALSILVECKVSLSDFRADGRKPWRGRAGGMGIHRYYLVTPKMETQARAHLPEGWGLLVARKRGVSVLESSRVWRTNDRREIDILLSVIRRIGSEQDKLAGVGIRCYTHEWAPENPAARLSIEA